MGIAVCVRLLTVVLLSKPELCHVSPVKGVCFGGVIENPLNIGKSKDFLDMLGVRGAIITTNG
jgi:hypothetical protein